MKLKCELISEYEDENVCKDKQVMLDEFFEFVDSLEYNSLESHKRWLDGMCNEIIDFHKKLLLNKKDNTLKEKQAQRNKLNREISALKKAELEQEEENQMCEGCFCEDKRLD